MRSSDIDTRSARYVLHQYRDIATIWSQDKSDRDDTMLGIDGPLFPLRGNCVRVDENLA